MIPPALSQRPRLPIRRSLARSARRLAIALAVLGFSHSACGSGSGSAEEGAGTVAERIWITPALDGKGGYTFHWQSGDGSAPQLFSGRSPETLAAAGNAKSAEGIYRATIPGGEPGSRLHYRIGGGPVRTIPVWDPKELRIAIVADWHGNAAPGSEAILRDAPHLLLTAGDNVTDLHAKGREGRRAYEKLIDSAPELFARIPVLPVSGNHDREIRPRGKEKPEVPVYDVGAAVFRDFFGLPDSGWRWSFRIPGHPVTVLALDLHHVSDFGTTWQSCQPFDADSEQVRWLRSAADVRPDDFHLFLYNERNATVRNLSGGAFASVIRRCKSAAVTGFGGFGERAEWEGIPFYNTHIHGKGIDYPDPHRTFQTPAGTYLLVTHNPIRKPQITLHLKTTTGEVLDTREVEVGDRE